MADGENAIPLSKRGETASHAGLKTLSMAWAMEQGLSITAPEVSFPYRKFRVDVAACAPVRRSPSRNSKPHLTSVLKAAVVFECKQARSDLIRDNKRHALISRRLKAMEERKSRMEALLNLHLPHLANGESLFPEFDSYRLREYRHVGYEKLQKSIALAKSELLEGTKFDRLLSYRLANLHYLVVEENLLEAHETPTGWGLLVRSGENLHLAHKPVWQDIHVEAQLMFLQRIACRKTPIPPPVQVEFPTSSIASPDD